MAKVTGVVSVKIDGTRIRVEGKPTLNFGGEEREPVIGDAVHGFRSTIVASSNTFNVAHMSDTDIEKMRDWEDVTAEYITDTGKTYAQTPATLTNSLELNEGLIEVTIQGGPAVEV